MSTLHKKIKTFKEVCRICRELQKSGKKIVFCHGFFDILHRGHVTLLVESKKLGDIVVVGVDHDDNAKILKGPKRPINDHNSRMFMLANLEVVDFVFLIDSFKQRNLDKVGIYNLYIQEIYPNLRPNIITTSIRAGIHGDLKKKQAKLTGLKFADIDSALYNKGTSQIVRRLGLD